MIAWRAGIRKEKTTPWNMDASKRWYQLTTPIEIATATKSAMKPAPTWPSCITRFRSMRSAMAPPKSAKPSIGSANPAFTRPKRKGEAVSSYVRYPLAIICICMPPIRSSRLNHRNRKSGLLRELNV